MFELLILIIIIAAFSVIFSKNIIQSVLYLILVFLLSSVLFIYLGADFIGLIILIVYIGAISVLFLFIVMMLNIRLLEIYTTFQIYLPLAFILCIILLSQGIYLFIKNYNFIYLDNLLVYNNWIFFNNIRIISIGELLFNQCYLYFIGATLLLFIAMIGVIVSSLEKNKYKLVLAYRIYTTNINWIINKKK